MYVTQALHRAVQQTPNRVATSCAGRRRTFHELTTRVARAAAVLRELGMQSGHRVAILALNSDRYLELQLAIPWGGGVITPCNVRWNPQEISYSVRDSGSTILVVDDAFAATAEEIARQAPCLREIVYAGDGSARSGMHDYETLIQHAKPVADAYRQGSDLYGLFYTGGTTGFPKGVMLSHTNVISSGLTIVAEGFGKRGAVYLHAAPMFHIADLALGMANLLGGNTHVFIPGFKPELMLEAVARYRVSETLLVPTMVQMLIDHLALAQGHDSSSLEQIVYTAAPMSETLLSRALAALPHTAFFHAYGMTELSPLITLNEPIRHGQEGRSSKVRSAGRATFTTEVRIVDPEGLELPRNVVGEVAVRGPNVMLGYWNQEEQTAAALRASFMHTGDAAYMDDDGFVFLVDRIKDMIKSGGENVFSAEVENALASHAAVAACAVIGIPSVQWGEAVHACVVLKAGASATEEHLIAHCRESIAGYKCPRTLEFVSALPLSGAGKVLKAALRTSRG